ncbi:MAG: hypothetical protein NTW69_12885 [Chloroflexi bacterium]|nr:hypothetical protein [Chloroflexota bacterium]
MFNNLSNGQKNALQAIFVLALCAGALLLLNYLIASRPVKNSSSSVRFEVQASGGFASITLRAGTVNMPEPTTVTAPWTRTIRVKSGTTVYLTASNPTATGEITCNIFLENKAWKTETISTPKNGVACAGIVP